MKTILALATALFVGTAFAQETKNMIEFNADSVLLANYAFNKSKTRSQDPDNDSQATFQGGYAMSLAAMPQLQVGGRVNYTKATKSNDEENYGLQIGVIWNHIPDLANALYASLYYGMQWNNTYGSANTSDENRLTTLAVGKRFDLKHWGVNHLTYTPEIALINQNSTTRSNIEYSQSVQLRVLQFSVFF
jgi:hypothetical protein